MSGDDPTIGEQIGALGPDEYPDAVEGMAEGYRQRALEAERLAQEQFARLVEFRDRVATLAADQDQVVADRDRLRVNVRELEDDQKQRSGKIMQLELKRNALEAERNRLREVVEGLLASPASSTATTVTFTVGQVARVHRELVQIDAKEGT